MVNHHLSPADPQPIAHPLGKPSLGDLTGEPLSFYKYEGLQNDFLLIDERIPGATAPRLALETRAALCARHEGVGADGVLTLLPPRDPRAQVRMHVTNADGSEPEMCGNGLRCVSQWLLDHNLVREGEFHLIDTDAGLQRCIATGGEVEVELPPPDFAADNLGRPCRRESVQVEDRPAIATAVSMGNPHLVLEFDDPVDPAWVCRVGPAWERRAPFPERANVGFVRVMSEARVELWVWERGAGLTRACGTGACAAVVALVAGDRVAAGAPIAVHLPGGNLQVSWAGPGAPVRMRGPARAVFSGVVVGGALAGAARAP